MPGEAPAQPENPGATVVDARPLTDVCFENFALHPLLLKGLEEAGFVRCTPIQALTLPVTLEGRDVAGQAQTGTGKTLAFLVTIINRLLTRPAHASRSPNDPRAVVLAPTRELAIQIDKDARAIARHTGLRIALIYGGVDYDKQRELLKGGIDIVIATPGRLIDYFKQHVVHMRGVDIVVLDEADRMFDLGFIKDIRFLLRRMPPREQRQSLLFSATLSHRVLELAYEDMNDAVKLAVETENVTADRVRQAVYFPANDEKLALLVGLLTRMDAQRTMVFVNTKVWCERVARALERAHFRVGVLSGDVPQVKREKLLAKFKRGELEILVATDVAARGLHIPDVSHVVNFDLPFDAEDYVHRIGRTARLGAEGDAISFACELYAMSLPDIEAYIGQKIPVVPHDPELLKPVARTLRELPAASAEAEAEPEHQPTARGADPSLRDEGGGRGRDGSRRRSGGRGERRAGEQPSGERRGGERPPGERRGRDRGVGDGERTARPRADAARGPQAPRDATPHAGADSAAAAAGDAPRKRRRRGGRGRRGGDRVETAASAPVAAAATAAESAAVAEPTVAATAGSPRLLARIKQRLKTLINRLPMPGRRR